MIESWVSVHLTTAIPLEQMNSCAYTASQRQIETG